MSSVADFRPLRYPDPVIRGKTQWLTSGVSYCKIGLNQLELPYMTQLQRKLYVGIPLSSALRKRLTRDMQTWPKEAIIPALEDNLHITLLFLGFVQEERLAEICVTLEEACADCEAFELTFTGMRLVDDPEHPKMIWLSGEPSDALKHLYTAIEHRFSEFSTEKKSFRPHVTLARIKRNRWQNPGVQPVLDASLQLMESVDTVALLESLTLNGKRRYDVIDTFALR